MPKTLSDVDLSYIVSTLNKFRDESESMAERAESADVKDAQAWAEGRRDGIEIAIKVLRLCGISFKNG